MLELSHRPPSQVEAALPKQAETLSLTGALARLRECDLPLTDIVSAGDREVPDTLWEIEAKWVRDDGSHWPFRVYARATEQELFGFHVELGRLAEDVAEAVRACRYGVGVQCTLEEPVLWHFHAQIRLLRLLAPEAAGVLDVGAARAHTADWLSEAATSGVPPHPDTLFSIHAVFDESERLWMHTHGLHRCGVIELDVVDVARDSGWALQHLLNAIAKRFIDHGYPEQDEPFEPGAGMELVWLPVEEGLAKLRSPSVGGWDDRDRIHVEDRAMLFVRDKGWLWGFWYRSLERLVPMLEDNPLLYVSNTETARAAALAAERLDRYRELYDALHEHPAFGFLVKLGYAMDGCPPEEREHLWFEVHGFEGNEVDATCINAPYHVAALAEGQRGAHSLDRLSDWAILSPAGQFGPDHIRVVELLANDTAALDKLASAVQPGS